ncbi:MAG: class I SAM-dependent methyltransferase [Desulfobulbaceae bacterium]|nr:class I SAM-dependent methyltransferase [Desulfobulbaceae bacterium]
MFEDNDGFFAEDLELMSAATNYLDWQVEVVKPYLCGRQLEIGAGVGNFSKKLACGAVSHLAIEPDEFCFRKLQENIVGAGNVKALQIRSEQLSGQPGIPSEYDSIVALNVLEHIENDGSALQSWGEMLSVGGHIVLLVPAGEWLYGEIDRKLHHYRRYSKQRVIKLVKEAGLRVVKMKYMNCVGMWAWFWNNKVMKSSSQDSGQIFVFDKLIVPWLRRIESFCAPPFGQSLFVVLGKE